MSLIELVERLVNFGIERDLAEPYVRLVAAGPSKAADVAKMIDVSRPQAYRTLEKLEQEGLATATTGRPVRYRAVPLTDVFERLKQEHLARVEQLTDIEDELAETIANVEQVDHGPEAEARLRTVRGRAAFYSTVEQMVRTAKHSIRILNTHPSAIRCADRTGLDERVDSRADAGLLVRVLAAASAKGTDPDRLGLHENAGLRVCDDASPMRLYTVDDAQVLLTLQLDPSTDLDGEGDVAIWTDSPALVATMVTLFDRLWGTCTVVDRPSAQTDNTGNGPTPRRHRASEQSHRPQT